MRRRMYVAGLFVLLGVWAHAAFQWRSIPQSAFGVGEELRFDVGWKAASAGEILVKVQEKSLRKNRPAYRIICMAETNSAIDMVFRVRDRFESWMDAQALCTLGFARRVEEGNYMKTEDIFIDPASGTFNSRTIRPKKTGVATLEKGRVPAYVQDLISVLFYLRAQPLKPGQSVDVKVLNGTEAIDMRFKVKGTQKVESAIGTISCVLVEPLFALDSGYGPNPKASATVWITDDKRHIPVQVTAELPFGHIDVTLASYKN